MSVLGGSLHVAIFNNRVVYSLQAPKVTFPIHSLFLLDKIARPNVLFSGVMAKRHSKHSLHSLAVTITKHPIASPSQSRPAMNKAIS